MDPRLKWVFIPPEQRAAFEQALRIQRSRKGHAQFDVADVMEVFDKIFSPPNRPTS